MKRKPFKVSGLIKYLPTQRKTMLPKKSKMEYIHNKGIFVISDTLLKNGRVKIGIDISDYIYWKAFFQNPNCKIEFILTH